MPSEEEQDVGEDLNVTYALADLPSGESVEGQREITVRSLIAETTRNQVSRSAHGVRLHHHCNA